MGVIFELEVFLIFWPPNFTSFHSVLIDIIYSHFSVFSNYTFNVFFALCKVLYVFKQLLCLQHILKESGKTIKEEKKIQAS